LAHLRQPALTGGQLGGQFITATIWSELGVLDGIDRSNLREEFATSASICGIRVTRRPYDIAVYFDADASNLVPSNATPNLDRPSVRAQHQHLGKQIIQRSQLAAAEP